MRVGRVHSGKFHGNLFANLASRFAAHHVNGCATRDAIKPRGQNRVGPEFVRVVREIEEHRLRHLFRKVRRADLPQSRRVNQINMTADQRGKSIFCPVSGKLLEQFRITRCHLQKYIVAD